MHRYRCDYCGSINPENAVKCHICKRGIDFGNLQQKKKPPQDNAGSWIDEAKIFLICKT
jgi:hypothetical protein